MRLVEIEPLLRILLPTDLHMAVWADPSPATLMRVYEHLRTLRRILHDYVPRQVSATPPVPGEIRHRWQEGALMFTDLEGFTHLMEANAALGQSGAETLLGVLNTYFAEMIEIISKAGGDLLEFTGDALLAQFPATPRLTETAQAVRAGLRMQRAMQHFSHIETPQGAYSLRMRVGVHRGRFVTADIGTSQRMERVLLGSAVQQAKRAEGAGQSGRVCLTFPTCELVRDEFHYENGLPGYRLVIDDLTPEQLGEYDLTPIIRRPAADVLWERSSENLVAEIEKAIGLIKPLACYLPAPTLRLIVENAARRYIQPDFPTATVLFVNLVGLAESTDYATTGEEEELVACFSSTTSLINAAVESRGGVLKKVTYHLTGSDMMIFFGVLDVHADDSCRAAETALAIHAIINDLQPPLIDDEPVAIACQMGIARGPVFSAEVGEPHGRREFNVLGDPVNTASRLMSRAAAGEILMTAAVQQELDAAFDCLSLGKVSLKGKTEPLELFALKGKHKLR